MRTFNSNELGNLNDGAPDQAFVNAYWKAFQTGMTENNPPKTARTPLIKNAEGCSYGNITPEFVKAADMLLESARANKFGLWLSDGGSNVFVRNKNAPGILYNSNAGFSNFGGSYSFYTDCTEYDQIQVSSGLTNMSEDEVWDALMYNKKPDREHPYIYDASYWYQKPQIFYQSDKGALSQIVNMPGAKCGQPSYSGIRAVFAAAKRGRGDYQYSVDKYTGAMTVSRKNHDGLLMKYNPQWDYTPGDTKGAIDFLKNIALPLVAPVAGGIIRDNLKRTAGAYGATGYWECYFMNLRPAGEIDIYSPHSFLPEVYASAKELVKIISAKNWSAGNLNISAELKAANLPANLTVFKPLYEAFIANTEKYFPDVIKAKTTGLKGLAGFKHRNLEFI